VGHRADVPLEGTATKSLKLPAWIAVSAKFGERWMLLPYPTFARVLGYRDPASGELRASPRLVTPWTAGRLLPVLGQIV
jgi:hypothetical protein